MQKYLPILEKFSQPKYTAFAKKFMSVVFLRVLQKGLGLLSVYFLINALTPEVYGQYQFILTVLAIFMVFTLSGSGNAIIQSVARGFPGTYKVLQYHSFFCSLSGSVLLLLIAAWYYWLDENISLALGFAMTAFLFPLSKGLLQWRAFKAGNKSFTSLAIWEGCTSIVLHLSIIGGVLLVPGDYQIPLLAVLAIPALVNIYQTYAKYNELKLEERYEEGSVEYSLKTTLYSTPTLLATHIEKVLLFFLLSPSALAIYVLAQKIPELLRNLFQDLGAVLAPYLAEYKSFSNNIDQILKIFSLAVGITTLVVFYFFMPWLFEVLFDQTYQEAVPYSLGLMLSVVIGVHANLRYRYIRSQMDSESVRDINLTIALARILVAMICIPIFGLLGAVISVLVQQLIFVYVISKTINKKYKNLT